VRTWVVLGLLGLGINAAYAAQTVTITKTFDCPDAKVSRRGDTVLVRCGADSAIRFTIAGPNALGQAPCPGLRVMRAANLDLTVYCLGD